MGLIILSLVERLSLSQRVPYRRFHCTTYLYVSCDGDKSHEDLFVLFQCAGLTHGGNDDKYSWDVAVVLTQN